MGRSKLLKDLVSGTSTLENILLRLKVIFSDLQDEKLLEWLDGEIRGYKVNELPHYRILRGQPMGTYIVNQSGQYKNAPVPLKLVLPEEIVNDLCIVNITDGLIAVENILKSENRENYAKTVPTELCHSISNPDFQILGMHIKIASNQLDGIISNTKLKLAESIMMLEKSFENIDDLDISSQIEEQPKTAQSVIYNIQSIIFDDTTEIKIGDKNKIKESSIGKFFRREK